MINKFEPEALKSVDTNIGQVYQFLTILEFVRKVPTGERIYSCRCICGNVINAGLSTMKSGRKKSCGCKNLRGRCVKDLKGQLFGKLQVVKLSAKRTARGGTMWYCQCSCGNPELRLVPSYALKRDEITVCEQCQSLEEISDGLKAKRTYMRNYMREYRQRLNTDNIQEYD